MELSFNKLLEMNNLLLFFLSSFISLAGGLHNCALYPPEVVYDLPEGFRVLHTIEKNGLLGVTDNLGNSVEATIDYPINFDIEIEICMLQKSKLEILEEKRYKDGSYKVSLDNPGPIDPHDTVLVIPKNGYVVRAYFFHLGDPLTHSAFDEKATKLVRSIAPGGRDGKSWKNCLGSLLHGNADRFFGEGGATHVPSVQVR